VGLIKRWYTALQKRAGEIGWSIAGGVIGAGIGLLFVTLYLRVR
jgi:hypothetical protein